MSLKTHFYKIPFERLEKIIDEAALTQNTKIFNFVLDAFKNREQFHVIEDAPAVIIEDDVEERRRT